MSNNKTHKLGWLKKGLILASLRVEAFHLLEQIPDDQLQDIIDLLKLKIKPYKEK